MKRTNTFLMILVSSALVMAPAFAQEGGSRGNQEVTVLGTAGFLRSTNDGGVRQDASDAGGVLFNYRYFFTGHQGVEGNYGLSNNNENYTSAGNFASIPNRSHEFSLAYVLRFPGRRVTPFALAGVGALVFDPKNFAGASTEGRAAFVYGGGADVNLTKHVYLRAEYRGFVYNSPAYGLTNLSGLDRTTHLAQPSLGFGYRF